jgi:alkylhydroperoxidase family enzyme
MIQTMNPTIGINIKMIHHHSAIMFGPSGLTRAERELLATVTSRVNECHY